MKLKALFAGLALVMSVSVFAADAEKIGLKNGVDAEVRAAIEAAEQAHKAVPTGFEWNDSKSQLEEAIKAANDGDKDKAKSLAINVQTAAESAMKQAEAARNAAPRF